MKKKVKNIVNTAVFTAITCILAQIAIPVPFSTVPFTLSVFAVLISGAFLKPTAAVFSQIVYLALGAVGLPVFANFKGGLSAIAGPTGGFLLAYPLMAFAVSFFTYKIAKNPRFLLTFLGMIVAIFVCHLFGATVYAGITNRTFFEALPLVSLPFLPFDATKALFAVMFFFAVRKRVNLFEIKSN